MRVAAKNAVRRATAECCYEWTQGPVDNSKTHASLLKGTNTPENLLFSVSFYHLESLELGRFNDVLVNFYHSSMGPTPRRNNTT